MWIYFFFVRLVALFGHKKAQKLVRGQGETINLLSKTIRKGDKTIWFHISSAGEFEQARPLIELLRKKKPEYRIIVTFFSPSGYAAHKEYPHADIFYLPFATRGNARKFLDLVQPQVAIFVKYDIWPAYVKELHRRKVNTYLISAIFRPSQFFFHTFGAPYRNLLNCFTRLYVQNEASKQLLGQYDIKNVTVCGDTRFDRVIEIAQHSMKLPLVERFVKDATKVIVAGSTWGRDDRLLARYVNKREDVKLILVSHDVSPERLFAIFNLFEGRYALYSQAQEDSVNGCRILVVDVVGKLSSIYPYGTVAYVGGGFGHGVHNTIEPAVYGMPVLFGPRYKNFREAVNLVANGGAVTFSNYAQLQSRLDILLNEPQKAGALAKEYVYSEKGATEMIYRNIWE